MILGTAGHIDHGKTALVHALTGVDTDRLPEEKKRGITIDLGFAPLRLDDGTTVGVVDVPGHEAFVRTMLAGATGIDLALIVIAADEGPMPQTHEHLAILNLLGVRHAVVALTKSDLVDAEWLTLVTEEVRGLVTACGFANVAIVPTSVVTQAGIDQLRTALATAAKSIGPRSTDDVFRLPVDRAFTVKGTGTVVTGTVWSGSLSVDETVRIMPLGASARVRGLQTHGASVRTIAPGMRAAIALAGVDQESLARGATLITNGDWEPTLVLRADITMLTDAPELRPRTKVRFHLATSDVGARVIATGSPVGPSSARPVRIVLDEPVIARAGDRFVLRSASPLATIGGGIVTDANATRRAKPMANTELSPRERLERIVTESGVHGVSETVFATRIGVRPNEAASLAKSASLVKIGSRWYASAVVDELRARFLKLVKAHHEQRPTDPGAPRQDIRSRLGLDAALFDDLVDRLVADKKLVATGAELRLAGRAAGGELTDQQRKLSEEILAAIASAGHEPPSVPELQTRFGAQVPALLRFLERQQRVVQVEDTRYYAPDAVTDLLGRLENGMSGKGELAPTDLRTVLGFSRKYLIPFLEYCDRKGYTARQGNGRVWRGQAVR